MSTKQEKCVELWRERPNSTAAEIAEAAGCSVVTARKAKPGNGDGDAGPITAAELRAVRDIAKKNGGLVPLIKEVETVASLAERFGGVGRLRKITLELAALLQGD